MKRIIIAGAALLAVVPASIGLIGNASFAQSVPVRVPSQATVLDDRGGLSPYAEPGDDKGGLSPHAEPGDDKGGLSPHAEPGDDKGGLSPHAEPGDDKGGLSPHAEPGDDKGGLSPHAEPGDDKVRDSGSGKSHTGVDDGLKGSRDGGSGHS